MAHALARRKLNQADLIERSVERLHPSDARRQAREPEAMRLLDDSNRLLAAGDDALAKAAKLKGATK